MIAVWGHQRSPWAHRAGGLNLDSNTGCPIVLTSIRSSRCWANVSPTFIAVRVQILPTKIIRTPAAGTVLWCHLTSRAIPIIKIRQSHDHLIYKMKIPVSGKTVFLLTHGTASMEKIKMLWDLTIRSCHTFLKMLFELKYTSKLITDQENNLISDIFHLMQWLWLSKYTYYCHSSFVFIAWNFIFLL